MNKPETKTKPTTDKDKNSRPEQQPSASLTKEDQATVAQALSIIEEKANTRGKSN